MPSLTPQIENADIKIVRRLSEKTAQGKVLTIYLNLDPSEFATPPARETQITSATRQAAQLIEELDQPEKKELRERLEVVKEFLLTDDEWTKDAGAVGVFCSTEAGSFDVIKLPEHVPTSADVGDTPNIRPMTEVVNRDRWCVALIDRRSTRLFLGTPSNLEEIEAFEDTVHRQHDQGGWSQARYERSVEEEVEDHLKHTCDRLLTMHRDHGFDHMVIGATEELWPRIMDRLHSYVSEDVVARLEVDNHNIGIDDLKRHLEEVAVIQDNQKERTLLDMLNQELGRGGRASAGLRDVLAALNEAKVDTLLVADGLSAEGVYCPRCGLLAETGSVCPADGEQMEQCADIVEKALEQASRTSATARHVKYQPDLQGVGQIASLNRF